MPTTPLHAGQKPLILFKTDATEAIGLGHLTRSLALAEVLKPEFNVHFFISAQGMAYLNPRSPNQYPAHHCEYNDWQPLLNEAGDQPHMVIIDDYRISGPDILSYRESRPNAFILATDDEGERFDAPVHGLINVSFRSEVTTPPPRFESTSLWGARFNPINNRFGGRRLKPRTNHPIKTLGVTMGGSDPERQGDRILEMAESLISSTTLERILFILGPAHADPAGFIAKANEQSHIQVIHNPAHVIDAFTSVDAMLTSAGGTTFELGLLGVPQIVLTVADNQRPAAEFLERHGFALVLPPFNQVNDGELLRSVADAVVDSEQLVSRAEALHLHLFPKENEENARSILDRIRHAFDASLLR